MSSESPSLRRKHGTKHKGRARLLFSREESSSSVTPYLPSGSAQASLLPSHAAESFPMTKTLSTTKQAALSLEVEQGWEDGTAGPLLEAPGRKRLSTQIRNSLDGYPTYHEMRLWLEMALALEQQVLRQEQTIREQTLHAKAATLAAALSEPSEYPRCPPLASSARSRPRSRPHTPPAQMALFQKKR